MSRSPAWKYLPNVLSLCVIGLMAANYFNPFADLDYSWQIRTGERIDYRRRHTRRGHHGCRRRERCRGQRIGGHLAAGCRGRRAHLGQRVRAAQMDQGGGVADPGRAWT